MKRLERTFFQRPTLDVAKDLLGKILKIGPCSGRINEVEAYWGHDDPASHCFPGLTERNQVMFGPAGHLYIYFTYGMYYCANMVTETEGFPAGILIRSVQPLNGIELMIERRGKAKNIADGPGKLCMAFGMTRETHNGQDLCSGDDMAVYDDGFEPLEIKTSSRIGITKGLDKEWRFYY